MAAGNQVSKLIVGQGGFLSTPAVSHLIRKYKTDGGFILTASHNPGGPDEDFGIKFNMSNGGPAPDAQTNQMFENTKTIKEYRICKDIQCDINTVGEYTYEVEGKPFTVQIIDPVDDYVALMKDIFNFEQIKKLVGQNGKLKVMRNGANKK